MSKKKKWIIIGLISLCLILLIALFLSVNASISGDLAMAGGTICIIFDKRDMLQADKIIISYGGETYTVTDPAFVRAFAEETLVGTQSAYCCSKFDDGWAEIYHGDRLLRRMRYIANHDAFAYEEDATHWVLGGKEGHAFLSWDTRKTLHEIIGSS